MSYETAATWYQIAANPGDARAMDRLGVCYYFGRGVAEDKEKGLQLIESALANGYQDAEEDLEAIKAGRII